MKLRAPAKVNLSLRILGKRPDGFHEIESLMAPVTLCDEITVETSLGYGVRVICDRPDIPQDDSNLAAVAARQFHAQTGVRFHADIAITKNIPAGAGLGGGSSDAATVLIALDSLFETHLGHDGLEEIAARIGSDVPFFIRRRPAWVRGRGEAVETASLPGHLPLVLIKPPFAVATSWAYKQWSTAEGLPDVDLSSQQWMGMEFVNDLERPVFEKFVALPLIRKWLLDQPGCHVAMMSGSGSTVFGICESNEVASALAAAAKEVFGEFTFTTTCETEM